METVKNDNENKLELKLQNSNNEDFLAIHKSVVKQLNKMDTNGLYLFHGQPGTRKSTYI